MQLLKERIIKDGFVGEGNILKVDSFLNHQIDVELLSEIGKEFFKLFKKQKIDKILTIEASGIAIGSFVAKEFGVPLVFAKKTESRNLDKETFESKVFSYTKSKEYIIRVSKKYLKEDENVLIIDDFLAMGKAALGLIDIVKQSNSNLSGVGIVIEKGFQPGGKKLRELGINLKSLAVIDSLDGEVKFR
ncbi:xanthine phosphoribosyltransferase [Oceanotoga sp. DSM 15011]|jgi:xanthine phosphoribosyltransferase|uniref:Xanthine phosphoribosyltransferase n=1 Tax=Oceanotoga teriensis TaxID=515440 RepID=A0AA45HIF6_9BACT|nr:MULTISPECIES: xanthine phosphoribosyltransferase [Oceanotoga]MDN5343380.1 xanthine phosphoribosyltransferase [Oceanotoga sp.]MDO7975750.1 xanthine phosphoribosyltransferase [Oceanotoga teriensis]PWJ91271.1 xanthine phosphoribosyltransferase [Oceanotoga teriensis]UYO99746.1 xanthine phosphoribosyltransferase [Oceanotoga sp. DSM 15011]